MRGRAGRFGVGFLPLSSKELSEFRSILEILIASPTVNVHLGECDCEEDFQASAM